MTPSAFAALLVLLASVVALPARADGPSIALANDGTLSRLIAESLSARPELAQSVVTVRAETERAAQADALPDPMLQVGIQNDGFTSIEIGRMDTSYVSLMAAQTVPWPGKRGLRKELAELGTAQARQTVTRVRLSTEAEVSRAYLDLLLVRDRLSLLEQLEALWQKSSGIARARYESLGGAQADLLRAQLELSRLAQRRLGLLSEGQARVQAINRLRAHPLNEPIVTSRHIRDLAPPATSDGSFAAEQALRESPELSAARLSNRRAERATSLAEKSYYPDLTVSAGIMYRGSLPPMWQLTLAGPIPLYGGGKQSRAVAETRAWAGAAEKQVVVVEQLLRWRTEERRTALTALRRIIDVYERGLLVQSRAAAESVLAQYQVGAAGLASVLEANAGFVADQEGYLESITAAYKILIDQRELSLAATRMPTGVAGSSAAMPSAPMSSSGTGAETNAAVGGSATSM